MKICLVIGCFFPQQCFYATFPGFFQFFEKFNCLSDKVPDFAYLLVTLYCHHCFTLWRFLYFMLISFFVLIIRATFFLCTFTICVSFSNSSSIYSLSVWNFRFNPAPCWLTNTYSEFFCIPLKRCSIMSDGCLDRHSANFIDLTLLVFKFVVNR